MHIDAFKGPQYELATLHSLDDLVTALQTDRLRPPLPMHLLIEGDPRTQPYQNLCTRCEGYLLNNGIEFTDWHIERNRFGTDAHEFTNIKTPYVLLRSIPSIALRIIPYVHSMGIRSRKLQAISLNDASTCAEPTNLFVYDADELPPICTTSLGHLKLLDDLVCDMQRSSEDPNNMVTIQSPES